MREMRDSGVGYLGEIPAEWGVETFSQLFGQRNEKVADTDYAPLSVTMRGVVPQLATVAKSDDHSNRKLVRRGDFAINSRSDRRNSCGFAQQDGSVSLINTICVPRVPMESRYFGYLFATSQWADEFYSYGHGIVADLWTTGWSDMKRIPVLVPPLAEQRRIADWLDHRCADIDAAVEAARASIDEYEAYKKSVISHAVTRGLDPDAPLKDTGIPWLGQVPEGWEIIKLGNLGTSKLGRMLDSSRIGNGDLAPYLSNADVGWFSLNTTDLKEMDFPLETREEYEIHDGDLLICEGGEIGKCCVWRGETPSFYYQKALHRFRPNQVKLDSDFLSYQLFHKAHTDRFYEVRRGETTFAHLTGEQLRQLRIPLPPLSEQQAIAAYLDSRTAAIDAVVAQKRAVVEDLLAYKKSLIYEAVTGKREV